MGVRENCRAALHSEAQTDFDYSRTGISDSLLKLNKVANAPRHKSIHKAATELLSPPPPPN